MRQIQDRLKYDRIRFAVEIRGRQLVLGRHDRVLVEQHRPQDGLFRVYILRRNARHDHRIRVRLLPPALFLPISLRFALVLCHNASSFI